MTGSSLRVGELRPNQLLHTYGVGAVADMPNLSVMVCRLVGHFRALMRPGDGPLRPVG